MNSYYCFTSNRFCFILLTTLVFFGCSKGIDRQAESQNFSNPPILASNALVNTDQKVSVDEQVKQLQKMFKDSTHYRYPDITLLANVDNPQKTAKFVKDNGGSILYDPNFGTSNRIPFLMFNLPPEKLLDPKIVDGLSMKAFEVNQPILNRAQDSDPIVRDMSIPTKEVKIPELRARVPGKARGEGVIVAVVDTGIDASHPAFGDRVIYWGDHTQELRTPLALANLTDGKIQVDKDTSIPIPTNLDPKEKIYIGTISESAFAAQLSGDDRAAGKKGIDLNFNTAADDSFFAFVGKDAETGAWVAYIDTSGTGKFSAQDLATPIADFNDNRSKNCRVDHSPSKKFSDMLSFPSRSRKIAYPVLIERDASQNPSFLSLGADLVQHGTHVAGIIAGNGAGIEGAAPEAKIMAIKVCSGITCTGSAMARGLRDVFYNSSGCIPDVVNISIGGPQVDYKEDALNMLLRDLSDKFGTTFFIAAGNDGPGYHTINYMGAFGPAVVVGAHASKDMFQKLYRGNQTEIPPENSLLYFSSAGPSYTGVLRPNIVAPGAAFSSVPLRFDGSAMMNGTSMATPLATGSAAALLSLAKVQPLWERVAKRREAKIVDLLSGNDGDSKQGSLGNIPLALRTAMEEGAAAMDRYTSAQQGYGLLDINRAYDLFLTKLQSVIDGKTQYAELDLNSNSKKGRVFDRSSLRIDQVKPINISLHSDGEADDDYHLSIRNSPMTFALDQVEIQNADGSVQTLKATPANIADLPFSVFITGQADQSSGLQTSVLIGDSLSSLVYSYRKLEKMEAGKTYVARYHVIRNGERIQTITDIVQKPIEFSDTKSSFVLPALSSRPMTKSAAFSVSGQSINVNQVHHYPVAVTQRDSGLSISLGIRAAQTGTLLIQVFDPEGNAVVPAQAITRYPIASVGSNPMIKFRAPVKDKKTGIYEVTVSTGSGRWVSHSQYDLLIEASRLRASAEEIALSTTNSKSKSPHEKTFNLVLDPAQLDASGEEEDDLDATGSPAPGKIDLSMDDPKLFSRELVSVVAQNWTFKKIGMPDAKSIGDKKSANLVIEISDHNDKRHKPFQFSGRIDHRLFTISDDGTSFTPVAKAKTDTGGESARSFADVPLNPDKPLYYAIETIYYMTSPDTDPGVEIDQTWDIIPVGANDADHGLKIVSQDFSKDTGALVFSLRAPDALTTLPLADKAALRLKTSIKAKNRHFVPLEIPVYVEQ